MMWSPWDELKRMREEMNRVFNDTFYRVRGELPVLPSRHSPLMDIYETPSEVVVAADMPGAEKNDIKIDVTEDTLTINAEVDRDEEINEEGYYLKERGRTKFYRKIPLPKKVKSKNVKASLRNGTLTVKLPKLEQEEKESVSVKVE